MRKELCECCKIESQMLDHEAGTKVADMATTGSLHVRGRNISQAGRLGDNLSMSQAQNRDVTVHLHMHVTIRMKIDDR
jgi:hypothetical protein